MKKKVMEKQDKQTRTHLVDELKAILVDVALVLELNRVEGEGGGGGEGDNSGSDEGHRLSFCGMVLLGGREGGDW